MSDPEFAGIGSLQSRFVEEMGEVLQAFGKAERFGYASHHPARPTSNNRDELQAEIADLMVLLEKLQEHADRRFLSEWQDKKAICHECLARVRQFAGQPGSERFCTHCSSDLFSSETAGEDVAEGQRDA